MAFKLTAVWEVINQEHQDHDFMCKVMGSGREGCAEGCLQCYRSCSLSETTDMWEGNAWERWGDLNRVVWESHLASAIIFKGTSGGFLHFERRPSLHSPCSGGGGGSFSRWTQPESPAILGEGVFSRIVDIFVLMGFSNSLCGLTLYPLLVGMCHLDPDWGGLEFGDV